MSDRTLNDFSPPERVVPHRVFFALWPSVEAAGALLKQTASLPWSTGSRRYPRQDLHLTLHFLGNIRDELLVELRRQPPVPFDPFELAFETVVPWPGDLRVAVPIRVPPELLMLRERIGLGLSRLGFTSDPRPFVPHVTLARRCGGMSLSRSDSPGWSIDPVPWSVTEYLLVVSRGEAPERYVPLERYACAASGAIQS